MSFKIKSKKNSRLKSHLVVESAVQGTQPRISDVWRRNDLKRKLIKVKFRNLLFSNKSYENSFCEKQKQTHFMLLHFKLNDLQ